MYCIFGGLSITFDTACPGKGVNQRGGQAHAVEGLHVGLLTAVADGPFFSQRTRRASPVLPNV